MNLTEELYKKITRYCAYQERCRSEVIQKLRLLGATMAQIESLTERLESEKFIDEERFTRAYVRGKFRINGWGRLKIRNGLRAKGVAEDLIRTALAEEIEEDDYINILKEILDRKGLKTALSRGFESSLAGKFECTEQRCAKKHANY